MRRVQQLRRLGLFITIMSVAIFLIHAWRQSHCNSATTQSAKRLISPEEEIAVLKQTIEELDSKLKRRGTPVPYDPKLGAAQQPRELVDSGAELFDRMVVFSSFVPPSVVTCTGHNATDRICRIKNLCFDPTRNTFFILKNGATIVQNGKQTNETRLADGTSIDGHNRFFIDYVESDPSALTDRPVHWVERVTYIMARFHRLNIMHTLHDDFLGIFHMAKLHGPANKEDPTAPFSLDTNIFFSDWYGREHYDYLFRMISQNPLQYRSEWRKSTTHPVCFAEAIVGNSKHTTWYNYGFLEPQGLIKGKKVNGLHVRDAARYMMRRLGVASWYTDQTKKIHGTLLEGAAMRQAEIETKVFSEPFTDEYYVTIFVRQRDRLILNLKELEMALEKTYGLPVRQVRMEDQTLTWQIVILRSTLVAVGLHGSALIMSMFLPPGAVLVELFPYAVPPENYTPYKTLTQLDGMRLVYRAWKNEHPESSQAHPERGPEQGGLIHLEPKEQQRIQKLSTVPPHLCCRDPTWLYRIYQDTTVNIGELIGVIDDGIMEAAQSLQLSDKSFYTLIPAAPDHIECEVNSRLPLGSREAAEAEENPLDMTITWSKSWNGVETRKYGVWIHQHFVELCAHNGTYIILEECSPGTIYDIWVRGYSVNNEPGMYSEKYQCSCAIGATANKIEKSVQNY